MCSQLAYLGGAPWLPLASAAGWALQEVAAEVCWGNVITQGGQAWSTEHWKGAQEASLWLWDCAEMGARAMWSWLLRPVTPGEL